MLHVLIVLFLNSLFTTHTLLCVLATRVGNPSNFDYNVQQANGIENKALRRGLY